MPGRHHAMWGANTDAVRNHWDTAKPAENNVWKIMGQDAEH